MGYYATNCVGRARIRGDALADFTIPRHDERRISRTTDILFAVLIFIV